MPRSASCLTLEEAGEQPKPLSSRVRHINAKTRLLSKIKRIGNYPLYIVFDTRLLIDKLLELVSQSERNSYVASRNGSGNA